MLCDNWQNVCCFGLGTNLSLVGYFGILEKRDGSLSWSNWRTVQHLSEQKKGSHRDKAVPWEQCWNSERCKQFRWLHEQVPRALTPGVLSAHPLLLYWDSHQAKQSAEILSQCQGLALGTPRGRRRVERGSGGANGAHPKDMEAVSLLREDLHQLVKGRQIAEEQAQVGNVYICLSADRPGVNCH